MRTIEAVLFDLDGTLLDTLADIAAAANTALERVGCSTHPLPFFRTAVGDGVEALMRRSLPPGSSDVLVAQAMTELRGAYGDHELARPYEGIPELLAELKGRGMTLAVLSNKPHELTGVVVPRFFGSSFVWVQGAREGIPLKPDPEAALAAARELEIPAERWAYVGDTNTDMHTGKAAGMFTVGVTWGFRDEPELREAGADAIIHHPGELDALLGRA